jgi:hypothetical protein
MISFILHQFPTILTASNVGEVHWSQIYWLLTPSAVYVILFITLIFRYRGLDSFYSPDMRDGVSSDSPYSEHDFILEQYEKYCKHREKLRRIIELKGHVDARERRHEYVLRDLIESKQFGHAEAYLGTTINLMREIGDVEGEITYITYMDRMRQFEAAAIASKMSIETEGDVDEPSSA